MKKKSICVLLVALFAGSGCMSKTGADSLKKPNVIILFSDQHNKKVMGFEGHPDVITPNLDKLANEAVVFDRTYCTVGVCVPSRSSLMTGLMPRTLGLLSNGGHSSVMDEAVSMASIFKHNGYKTYAFGKRHLRNAIDEGWDVKKDHGFKPGDDDNYISWIERKGYAKEFAEDWAAEFGRGPRGSSEFETNIPTADLGTRISKLPEEYTMEAYTATETIKMIKGQAEREGPFFCWASFYRPHQPYNPLPRYLEMYDVSEWGEGSLNGSSIKMPPNFYEPTENLPPMLLDQRNGGNKVWNMDKAFEDEQLWRNFIGAYYALVTEIDHHVGEILKALEEAGLEQETIVIYTSDHGDFVGNHGMVEKCAAGQNVYEDILNVPLLIKYPGKTRGGTRIGELVTLADVLPTLVDLLELDMPELTHAIQGESLADVLFNNGSLERDYIVSESWSQATVITKESKLGMMLDPTAVHADWDYREFGDMFFDRGTDPLEIHNKIHDPGYAKEIEKLTNYYEEYTRNTPATGKKEMIQNAKNEGQKPNIVFILADDMGYGDLGCYNSESKIATPNIDGLAEQGVRFTNAHAAGAWCVPSRYGLLTGRYPGRLESLSTKNQSLIKADQETVASILKRSGYHTACIGKWHQGFVGLDWDEPGNIDELKDGPVEKGFDYFFGMHASLDIPPYFYIENDHAVQSPGLQVDDHASPDATSDVSGAFYRGGGISPDFKHEEVLDKFLEKAFAFLDRHQDNKRKEPFFLYFPLTAPHTPWLPDEEFVGKSGAGEYGDFTMQVDHLVGKVLAYLEDHDLMDNTIVFFSSDNGPVWFHEDIVKYEHASVGDLRGMKGDMWEGGSRIPFIVSAPSRYSPGRESDQLISFTDLLATLADLVDEELPDESFDSHSFLPVLKDKEPAQPLRKELIIEKNAILSGDWKFIDGSGQGGIAARWAPDKAYILTGEIPGELYNLKEDLSEQNNLYDTYPAKANELFELLKNIRYENQNTNTGIDYSIKPGSGRP